MDNKLVARYLAGSCTKQEKASIQEWLEADPANRELMKEYEHIWEASEDEGEALSMMFNVQQDWRRLRSRINAHEPEASSAGSRAEFEIKPVLLPSRWHSGLNQAVKVAAVMLIAAFMGIIAYQNFYEPPVSEPVEPALREIITQNAQRANLTLSDGTRVQLNADSKLQLPDVFHPDKREVYLEGEAFFDVARNPEKPFIIYSDKARVQVLGTSLGVRSYPGDEFFRVVVKEGKVSVKSDSENEEAVLEKNELATVNFSNNNITVEEVQDMELYLGWTEGFLKFRDSRMVDVKKELERKYDISVVLADEDIAQMRLTAVLKSKSIRNVLDVIATSLDIDYTMDQQEVVFRQKNITNN